MTCDHCGQEIHTGSWPWCPHGIPSLQVQDDTWVGGKTFENLAEKPVTFYNRGDYKAYLNNTGQREFVRHVGAPGSDKSKHTQRWI